MQKRVGRNYHVIYRTVRTRTSRYVYRIMVRLESVVVVQSDMWSGVAK